ncbi:MAG: protein-disulfide reductase DsbD [Pseudomonadota bacterium]
MYRLLYRRWRTRLTTLLVGAILATSGSMLSYGQESFSELLDKASASSTVVLPGQASMPEFLPVEEAYRLALEVSDQRSVRLLWQIADGYYLYEKRFAFTFADSTGEVALTPSFPDGVMHEDEYFGISEVHYSAADIQLALARPAQRGTLTITSQGCADAGLCYPPQKQRFEVDFQQQTVAALPGGGRPLPGNADESAETAPNAEAPQSALSVSTMLYMALLAFVGGSILNLMPCVFPVLSLKVFSLASSKEHASHVHGWVYAIGVVTSFVLVAAVLITLQRAGAAVGWGFQLQEPRFVALLAYLFFVMGLSLSGLVELGAGFMGAGSRLADQGGYSGSFFTGVLATVVASPCTAPFMGTALGFAVTQSAPVALLIFAALGSGMAAPMLLLSYSQRLRNAMPRPGPWMETFKQLLAFPLYATAIWLLWVSGRQTSVTVMAMLLCGMLALTLGLWLWQRPMWGRIIGAAAMVGALLVIPSPMFNQTQATSSSGGHASDGWSVKTLDTLLAEGKPVFVNVTADWCITCLANEKGTLGSASVEAAMESAGITYLVADWTDYDAGIADFLATFGRNGVPLYLVYSGKPGEAPQVLPQLLTPGIVLDALEKASQPGQNIASVGR